MPRFFPLFEKELGWRKESDPIPLNVKEHGVI